MAEMGMLRARGVLLALVMLSLALFAGSARAQEPIKIGFSDSLTGGPRVLRQGASSVQANLGRRNQRKGRIAGPSGQARLLR